MKGGLVTIMGEFVSSGFGLLGDATETYYYEGTEAEMPTEKVGKGPKLEMSQQNNRNF